MNYLSYRISLIRLHYKKDKEEAVFHQKLEEAKRTGNAEVIQEIQHTESFPLRELDEEISVLMTQRLTSIAQKLLLPLPPKPMPEDGDVITENEIWRSSDFSGRWYLRTKGIAEVRKLIRQERKERLELITPWISLIGLVIALLMMFIAYLQLEEARKERIAAKFAMEKAAQAEQTAASVAKDMNNMKSEADKKLSEIDDTLQKASKTVSELKLISEFATTVLDAQNDNRKAFDRLSKWSGNSSNPFSSRARDAWMTIYRSHSLPYYVSYNTQLWKSEFDRSKLSIKDFRKIYYEQISSDLRPSLIQYIWERNDISKKDKMQFLIDIVQSDESLRAVEYAGRLFTQGAGLNASPLQVDLMLKWWQENKNTVK